MLPRAAFRLAAALCAALSLQAESEPQLPCGAQAYPSYPEREGAPTVKIWEGSDWTPPACTGWSRSESATVVVTVARFRHAGGIEGLRRRIGAVSEMSGLLYWSTSHQKWLPLIIEAYGLSGPDGEQRRKDFTPDEIASGRSLYVGQEDNLLGRATYELRIVSAEADRLVFGTENISTIRYFGLPLFQPREIQSICFLGRESKEVWRYYHITRISKRSSLLTIVQAPSLINRAVAFYRFLSGIPADQEPPAAR